MKKQFQKTNKNLRKVDMAEPWRQQLLQMKKELSASTTAEAYAKAVADDAPFSILLDAYEAKQKAEKRLIWDRK